MATEDDRPARRICIVGPAFPFRGGIAHYTACLSNELAKRGNLVQILNYRSLYPRWLFPGTSMLDSSEVAIHAPQQQILRPLAPWTWISAVFWIRKFHPDAVVIQWWHVFFAPCLLTIIALCRAWLRVQVAVLCHNVSDHEKHELLNRIAVWLLLRSGASLIVHSAAEAKPLQQKSRTTEIFITPHPTYEVFSRADAPDPQSAREQLGLPPGPLVLFFGLVRKYKGLEDSLRAIARLKPVDGISLLIAGEFYEPVEKYERIIAELEIADRVRIVNRYIANEELPLFFCAADVLVAPYWSASQSGVVSIATAFALPAIVTDVGGLPEMVEPEKTGLVVPPHSPDHLANAIHRFFNENLAQDFAQRLTAESRNRTWDTLSGHVEQLAAR